MSHTGFVTLAYGVSALVLAWDFLMPQWRLRQVRRGIALRVRRQSIRKSA